MAILSYAKEASVQVMEAASRKALNLEIYSYKYFKMLIKKESAMKEKKPERIILNSNLRGKNAYAGGDINA